MALPSMVLEWFENQQRTGFSHPASLSFCLFFTLVSLLWFNRVRVARSTKLPPAPPKLPIIGHLHCLGTLPHRSLEALSRKYGSLMLLHLGYTPTLVVSSADMGREIMKTHDGIFANRPITTAAKEFLYGGKDVAFAPHGEYWRQACDMRRDVNLSDLIAGVTNNVISRVALGRSFEGEHGRSEYSELTKDVMQLFGKFSMEDMFPSLGWVDVLTGLKRKMRKTSKAMHQFLNEVVEEHLMAKKDEADEADQKDLVDLLLEYAEGSSSKIEFTRENLRSVILDMFVAGTDTTYTTLEWAMAELINHPDVMKKVQEEVRRVAGKNPTVYENDISEMEYFNCVIKETLRLHPPVVLSLPRVSTTSVIIEGYHISAKTRVIINIWAISRDPKIWDKPDAFIPERFLKNPIDFKGKDFEYIPFGAGRRVCPGISFGIASVESILANLLHRFDWELPNKMDIDMTEDFGLSVNLKYPLHLVPVSHFS
ncbi:hypothetical protein IFM89_019192 [Coptis chinensis]|uniref:Cytochrome P450 n=2 Tax=Coptis chinensis TaxID=261450 RepID=A0A835M5E5_9MAGN|nr:hypothetical protein IFM89_019192 [Coptis chinensis]